jgi:hypothetical protein
VLVLPAVINSAFVHQFPFGIEQEYLRVGGGTEDFRKLLVFVFQVHEMEIVQLEVKCSQFHLFQRIVFRLFGVIRIDADDTEIIVFVFFEQLDQPFAVSL